MHAQSHEVAGSELIAEIEIERKYELQDEVCATSCAAHQTFSGHKATRMALYVTHVSMHAQRAPVQPAHGRLGWRPTHGERWAILSQRPPNFRKQRGRRQYMSSNSIPVHS